MKAIIPVAGYGKRFEPYSLKIQKCLLPVAGKPVLEHIIDKLINIGIDEVILVVGHLSEQVKSFSLKYKKIKLTCIDQKERLGLGHAIYQAIDLTNDPILILLGDSVLELDYNNIIENKYSTIGVAPVPDPERFGIVEIDDNNNILNFWEKPKNPPSNMAISGIYYINSQFELVEAIDKLIINNVKTNNEYQLTDAFKIMLKNNHKFKAVKVDNCLDCGLPKTLLSTNKYLLQNYDDNAIDPSAKIVNSKLTNCTISMNCTVINSNLNNIIMLSGSSIINKNIKNAIID